MLSADRKQRNRDSLGSVLKERRTAEGYTQKGLADALGIEYYTMISQMELGYISIPSSVWLPIAKTLRMNPSEWVLRCLKEYQPEVYAALFEHRSLNEASVVLTLFHKGLLDELIKGSKNES